MAKKKKKNINQNCRKEQSNKTLMVVIDILREYVDDDIVITENSLLFEDIGLGSIDIIQIISLIDAEFNIKLDTSKINNIYKVKDLVEYIESEKK